MRYRTTQMWMAAILGLGMVTATAPMAVAAPKVDAKSPGSIVNDIATSEGRPLEETVSGTSNARIVTPITPKESLNAAGQAQQTRTLVNNSSEPSIKIRAVDASDSVSRVDDEGVSLVSVLHEGQSRAKFSYSLPPAFELELASDGSILIRDGQGDLQATKIQAPWALDSTGKELDTHYRISENTIVQVVDTRHAKFPIAADPKITYGIPPVALNAYGLELQALAGASAAIVGGGPLVGCSVTSRIPHPVGQSIANLACGVIGVANLPGFLKFVESALKLYKPYQCYQLALVPLGNSFEPVSSGCGS